MSDYVVAITGMTELPKGCNKCVIRNSYGKCLFLGVDASLHLNIRHPECPLELVKKGDVHRERHARVRQLLPVLNNAHIARETGYSQERVRQLRARYGIEGPLSHADPGRPASRKYTYEIIKNLYDKHDGNVSAMARELGVTQSGVSTKCKQYGLRGRGRHKRA